MIGESSPINAADAHARELADMRRRIAELERATQRRRRVIYAAKNGNSASTFGATPALMSAFTITHIPARGTPGMYMVYADAYLTFGGGPDYYEMELKSGGTSLGSPDGTIIGAARINAAVATGVDGNYSVSGFFADSGEDPPNIGLWLTRQPGGAGGSGTFFGTDPRYMHLHAIFFPS